MRAALLCVSLVPVIVLCGCAGPERKLGRGLYNIQELVRGGEVRRSMEQTSLWEGPDAAYTTGLIRGFHRSLARTIIGAIEIATAPLPPYGPWLTSTNYMYPDFTVRNKTYPWGGMVLPEYPVYPDAHKPGILSDSIFATDTALGFSGGDVAPMVPGSRFKIFDN